MCVCVCVKIHFNIYLKLTQYYKSIKKEFGKKA